MTRQRRPPPAGVVDERLRARMRDAVEGLGERLQALQDDWGNHAEPRRPQLGHLPSCPNLGRPMRRCGWCRAEALEAHGRRAAAGVVRALIDSHPDRPRHPEPAIQERACSRCYRPTTLPDLCERCQPGGITS